MQEKQVTEAYDSEEIEETLIVVKIWSGILAKFGGSKNEAWFYVEIASSSTIIYIFQQYNRVIRQADAIAWLLHYAKKYDVFRSFTSLHKDEQKHTTEQFVRVFRIMKFRRVSRPYPHWCAPHKIQTLRIEICLSDLFRSCFSSSSCFSSAELCTKHLNKFSVRLKASQ